MPAKKRVTLVVDVNVLVSMLINHDAMGVKGMFNKQVFHDSGKRLFYDSLRFNI